MIANHKEYEELSGRKPRRKLSESEKIASAIVRSLPKVEKGESPVVNVTTPEVTVNVPKPDPFPDELVFDIIRDKEGRMKQVVMRKP